MKQIKLLVGELYEGRPGIKQLPIKRQLVIIKHKMMLEGYTTDKIDSTLIKIYEMVGKLNELEFTNKGEFDAYAGQHKIKDTTKVKIGDMETTAGAAKGKKPKAEKQPSVDKDQALNKKITDKFSTELKRVMSQIPFKNDHDQKVFNGIASKLETGGKFDKSEIETFNKYAGVKDASGMTTPEIAIYITNAEGGNPPDLRQGHRVKISLGSSNAVAFIKSMTDQGMNLADATTTQTAAKAKIATKMATGVRMADGRSKSYDIDKTYATENGKKVASKLVVGETVMHRQPAIDISKATNMYKSKGMSDNDAKAAVEQLTIAVDRHNRLMDTYAGMDSIESVDLVEGASSFTKDGRKKLVTEGPKVMAKKMLEYLGTNPTAAEKDICNKIAKLSDTKDATEFDTAIVSLMNDMRGVESMKKGVSDLAEPLLYLSMCKKGIPAVLPSIGNFKVADILVFPSKDPDPKSSSYLDQLVSGGETVALVGGISVKNLGGAASSATAKMDITHFNNPDTRGKCNKIIEQYSNTIGGPTVTNDSINTAKKNLDDTEKWARDNKLFNDAESKFADGRTPKQWANDTIAKWMDEDRLPKSISKENIRLLVESYEQYARGGLLLQAVHNNDIKSQDYGNLNVTKNGVEYTNGITSISAMNFSPNPGFVFPSKPDKDGMWRPRANCIYAGNLVHRAK